MHHRRVYLDLRPLLLHQVVLRTVSWTFCRIWVLAGDQQAPQNSYRKHSRRRGWLGYKKKAVTGILLGEANLFCRPTPTKYGDRDLSAAFCTPCKDLQLYIYLLLLRRGIAFI